MAAGGGHIGVVQLLINRGAEVNRADVFGRTPLKIARLRGHTGASIQLVRNGGIV